MSVLFPNIRLVVFDFDCTITHRSTCGNIKLDDVINKGANYYIQSMIFRKFIEYLLRSGVAVAIATYGKKDIVLTTMVEIFPNTNPFTILDVSVWEGINWKECQYPPEGYNKNNMLKIFARKYKLQNDQMLLIDYSAANVITAHNAGYNALFVPGCKGFVETLKQLPLHRQRGECIHCSPLDDQTLLNLSRAPALKRSSVSQGEDPETCQGITIL